MEYEELASQGEPQTTSFLNKDSEVPMVIWLRGDEPDFSDFSMDADQVMKILGIRRSRLNQISGRELRVGRARVNSYIRPVYRPCDVEEYLKWIRPTASHKKSSEVLEEARTKLEQQSEKLLSDFTQQFNDIAASFYLSVQESSLKQRKFSKSLILNLQKSMGLSMRALVRRSSLLQTQANTHWTSLAKHFTDLKELLSDSQFLKLGMTKVLDLMTYSEKALVESQQGQNKVLAKLETLHQELLSLKEEQAALKKQVLDIAKIDSTPSLSKIKKYNHRIVQSSIVQSPSHSTSSSLFRKGRRTARKRV